MKKIVIPSWLIIIVGVTALLSVFVIKELCPNEAQKKLKETAEEINGRCPERFGDYGIVTSCSYERKKFSMTLLIDENFLNIDKVSENKEQMKQDMLMIFVNNKEIRSLMELVYDADASYNITYVGNKTGKTFDLHLAHYEISTALHEKRIDPKAALAAHIRASKLSLPRETEPGIICMDVIQRDGYVQTMLYVDENQYDMAELRSFQNELKESYKDSMLEEPLMKNELNLMVAAFSGVKYHHIGNLSGERFTITFDWTELVEIEKQLSR